MLPPRRTMRRPYVPRSGATSLFPYLPLPPGLPDPPNPFGKRGGPDELTRPRALVRGREVAPLPAPERFLPLPEPVRHAVLEGGGGGRRRPEPALPELPLRLLLRGERDRFLETPLALGTFP